MPVWQNLQCRHYMITYCGRCGNLNKVNTVQCTIKCTILYTLLVLYTVLYSVHCIVHFTVHGTGLCQLHAGWLRGGDLLQDPAVALQDMLLLLRHATSCVKGTVSRDFRPLIFGPQDYLGPYEQAQTVRLNFSFSHKKIRLQSWKFACPRNQWLRGHGILALGNLKFSYWIWIKE